MKNQPVPSDSALNLAVFSDALDQTKAALERMGAKITAQEPSPFGTVLTVQPGANSLSAVAGLSGVQMVEMVRHRVPANDLSRVTTAEAPDTVTNVNYLGLSGSNVLVSVNDSGVDATHPDLNPRVIGDFPISQVDTNGHGTHVAGIIASSGAHSPIVTFDTNGVPNIGGSTTNANFRGKAPSANIFSMDLNASDSYLQETAARTNAFISNNSWNYGGDFSYDLAAASYDAAVRDALPEVTGPQPALYVFSAGDSGGGSDNGAGGQRGTIASPGTAKNVITVGALEQFRTISNTVVITMPVNGTNVFITNTPWSGMTSSSNEVASYSSRGNVGVGIEGDFGRFKPDVVAPGTFVVSTRPTQGEWDQNVYYHPTNYFGNSFSDAVAANSLNSYGIFVPDTTTALTFNVFATNPVVNLPVYLNPNNPPIPGSPPTGTNSVSVPTTPPAPFSPADTTWFYSVGNPTNVPVGFNAETILATTNNYGTTFVTLSNLNNALGPLYRYETGTSMSAAEVSGTLALFQEFFQRLNITNSPALMKALLINGARPANFNYDFRPLLTLNLQGWGLINLTNSLPAALTGLPKPVNPPKNSPRPMLLFDPNQTNALATGQSRTYTISLNPDAQNQTLQVTLVWTDPPGNPAAGPKLVNNLDLIVTNLDTTNLVYFGNDIQPGNTFNQPWDGVTPPNQDFVNNVENVYLSPLFEPLGTNYSVTVFARSVNVNAVTLNTNNIVQDYALVISSGNGDTNNQLTLMQTTSASSTTTNITLITNSLPVLNQRVGANFQLTGTNTIPLTNTIWGTNGVITLGETNQWHFFVVTNTDYGTNGNFTNAAFITFMPPNLSVPRIGVNANNQNNATRVEADIDLYVTTNATLLLLDPAAVADASKSLGRGGTEAVVLTKSSPGTVYYVGVKSEDQMAAQFGFFGTFSDQPFSPFDVNGNEIVRGIPVPAPIPDGSPSDPGAVMVFGIATQPINIRRVVVTNIVEHENFGDLLGTLTHNDTAVVLNNHTFGNGNYLQQFIYEDNGEGDIPGSQHTDGPGSLTQFIGTGGVGVWQLTMVDNALGHTGQVDGLFIRLEPEPITNGNVTVNLNVQPASFAYASIDVPPNATNLTVSITGNTDPVQLYVRRGALPTQTAFDYTMTIIPPGGLLTISTSDLPPLTAGTYFMGVFNGSGIVQNVTLVATLGLDVAGAVPTTYTSTDTPMPILDDAVTDDSIFVPVNLPVVSVNVGMLIQHPRVSDLAITLISPNGTRVLLSENRGGATTNGFGVTTTNGSVSYLSFTEDTNLAQVPIKFAAPPFGNTNLPMILSDFEAPAAGDYTNGVSVNGWAVQSNEVSVLTDATLARGGTNLLALADGRISRALPTVAGRQYTLSYAYRGPKIVSWWRGEGNMSDSVGANNGTAFNGGPVTYPQGMVGQAFRFDGTIQRYIRVPYSPTLLFTNKYTWEMWYRDDNIPYKNFGLFSDRGGGTDPCQFGINFNPALGFYYNDNTYTSPGNNSDDAALYETSRYSPMPAAGMFHHLAGVYEQFDPTHIQIKTYVDGRLVRTKLMSGNMVSCFNTIDVCLGTDSLNDQNMNGLLDEISVYGRALSGSEVHAIYAAGGAGKFDTNAPIPDALAKAQVVLGTSTNVLFGNNTNWQTKVTSFTAPANGMPLQLTGLEPGMLVDSFALTDNSSNNLYYLPEQSLDTLVGENAQGAWTLEILDNRTGATNPTPFLVSWQLQFIFASNTPAPISLTHAVPATNTIPPGQILYYTVDVPPWAGFATNILDSATMPVNVFFNQTNPPTGAAPGDFTLVNGQTAPPAVIGNPVLSAATTPPLVPGARYYLGVQNPNLVPVTVVLEVDFDITALNNAVPLSSLLTTNVPERYFSYDVSTNAMAVIFQLFNLSGNLDLVARKGGPLPTLFSNDYGSFNPGTNDENIVVFTNSTPVALSPGRWYLGVFNRDVTNVTYTIEATEVVSPTVIPLTNAIPFDFSSGPGPALTNFFSFTITNSASAALFELYNLSGNADLTLQRGNLPLAPPYFGSSALPGTNSEQIVIRTNGVLPDINGIWYLGVPNNDTNTVTYTIRAVVATNVVYNNGTVIVTNGILISGLPISTSVSSGTNGLTLMWNAVDGENYEIDVSTNLFNWSIVTNIIASGTKVTYVDTNAPAIPPIQFYRIKQIPVP